MPTEGTTAPPAITMLSSMATKALLAELAPAFAAAHGHAIAVESIGGVEAARRVREGEAVDTVLLAADAIEALVAAGAVVASSRVAVVRSPMACAVRAGAAAPSIATEAALREAVLGAASIGYSTGPSGSFLLELLARWGLTANEPPTRPGAPRLVQARPGVPVARLVAEGEAALGFQQLSELQGAPGIQVLGTLPAGADFVTTFTAARCTAAAGDAGAAQAWLEWLASPATAEAKRRHGMAPA
jgi:molybdate transport system substrate-binding protein